MRCSPVCSSPWGRLCCAFCARQAAYSSSSAKSAGSALRGCAAGGFPQPCEQLPEGDGFARSVSGAPQRGQQGAVVGEQKGVVGEAEVVGEGLAQGRQEGKRSAAEQQRRTERAAARKGHDRLHGYGVEDRGGDVGGRHVTADEVLHVGLREDAASRRDGVDAFGLQGQFTQARHLDAQQQGHLVDEGARAAGAVAVHAQVGAALVEEHHLGVLAADVDQHGGLRVAVPHVLRGGHDLLHELRTEAFGRAHAHRSGDGRLHRGVAQFGDGLLQVAFQQAVDLGVVAFVA